MAGIGGDEAPPGPRFVHRHMWDQPHIGPTESNFHVGEEVYYLSTDSEVSDFVHATIMSIPFRKPDVRKNGRMRGYTVRFIHPVTGNRITQEVPYNHETVYLRKLNRHLPGPSVAGPDGAARSNEYLVRHAGEAAGAPEPRRSGLPRPRRGGAGGPRY